ncbi:MAG: IclR family transcriptional regulator [Rhodobacteraceae bacterium]|nr:IclR family transcriptional regulator [Paracoccaceae bacterium]
MKTDSANKEKGGQGVQVIARAADILRVLKNDNEGLSLGQIAKRVSLPRSTVQRIVNALLAERLVMSASPEGGLRLGSEIQALAAAGRINVVELIHPMLAELANETGETVDLSVYRDNHVLFVDQVVGSHRLRTVSAVGEAFPMVTTATGKATMALLDEEQVATIAARELRQNNKNTRSLSEVIAEIETVRKSAVAFDLDEHTSGISAAAMAFRDPAGLIYSISLPVPSHRFAAKRDMLVKALRKTMKTVEAAL